MTTDEALKEIRRGMEHARIVYDPQAWNVVHDELQRLKTELEDAKTERLSKAESELSALREFYLDVKAAFAMSLYPQQVKKCWEALEKFEAARTADRELKPCTP